MEHPRSGLFFSLPIFAHCLVLTLEGLFNNPVGVIQELLCPQLGLLVTHGLGIRLI